MEHAARPYGAAAVIVAAGALVLTAPMAAPSGPDPQLSGVELTALVDLQQTPVEDLMQAGTDAHTSLPGDTAAASFIDNPLFNIDTSQLGDMGQDVVNGLLGPDFGGQSITDVLTGLDPGLLDMSAVGGNAGLLAAPGLAAISAADASSAGAVAGVQALVTAEQNFVDALVLQEEAFNAAIVANQATAVSDVFGDNTALSELATQLFGAQNALLYHQESLLNGMLFAQNGVDPSSLGLGAGDLSGLSDSAQATLSAVGGLDGSDWSALAQLTPADWSELIDAGNFSNFYTDVLPDLDWAGLFGSVFPF